MNKKIIISICIAGLILSTLIPLSVAANEDHTKIYTGPKTVFDEKGNGNNIDPEKGNNGKGKPPKPPQPPAVDKWAVVIGIADYRGVGNDLSYPDDDAMDMYNYLLSKGYPSDNIKLLLNKKATATAIVSAIDWLNGKEENPTSECVFFYSGHGSTYDGYDDGDTEYTDEGIVSHDLYLILDGQLRDHFSTFASQKIVFIFDSCFSGGMDDLSGSGRIVETACDEDQLSWDGDSTLQNGVFTYYFIQQLYVHSNIEDTHADAAPLAHNWALTHYGATMDPQIYDQYTGTWTF